MKACLACQMLVGNQSEVPPHEDLQRVGSGVFGTPQKPIARYIQYRCRSCGSWLNQNTDEGSPAGVWSGCGLHPAAAQIRESETRALDARRAAAAAVAAVLGRPR
jgi:hypothetical protein